MPRLPIKCLSAKGLCFISSYLLDIKGIFGKLMDMEKGFNSDLVLQGKTYHIQTEDWGDEKALVVTRVFQSGSVVWSIKTTYQSIEQSSPAAGRKAIQSGMRDQHQRVLDQLISGAILISSLK